MKKTATSTVLVAGALVLGIACLTSQAEAQDQVLPELNPKIEALTAEFDQIPEERKQVLKKAALFIRSKMNAGEAAKLTFICTHNSRRSHMSQIWAQTAAMYYGIENVNTYSGGTETTACNPRTVAALERAGFKIENTTDGDNPIYHVTYAPKSEPIKAFSKIYHDGDNPKEGFAAMMCCDHADINCPVVDGASIRLPIHYIDPKVSDDTDREAETYDARCHQIGREMFYLMSQVKA